MAKKFGLTLTIPTAFDLSLPRENLDKSLGKDVWAKPKPSFFKNKIFL